MEMKPLAISSLSFLVPAFVALYRDRLCISSCLFVLVATSLANHQFGIAKNVDRFYARTFTLVLTCDAFARGGGHFYAGVCGIAAGLMYKFRRNVYHHVLMHVVGAIGFTIYVTS
jgi:hypothetical protein